AGRLQIGKASERRAEVRLDEPDARARTQAGAQPAEKGLRHRHVMKHGTPDHDVGAIEPRAELSDVGLYGFEASRPHVCKSRARLRQQPFAAVDPYKYAAGAERTQNAPAEYARSAAEFDDVVAWPQGQRVQQVLRRLREVGVLNLQSPRGGRRLPENIAL